MTSELKTPLPKPAPARGSTSQREVLAAAEEIFAAKGFAGASLDDIAARLGIRRPSLLHYHPSKRRLYDAVEEEIFAALSMQLDHISCPERHIDRLSLLLATWLDFMIARPTAARIILRNASDIVARSANPTDFSEAAIARFEAVVRDGIAAGEFQHVHPTLLISIIGTSLLHFVCNAESFGADRSYDPRDPETRATFFAMLAKAARALLLKDAQPA